MLLFTLAISSLLAVEVLDVDMDSAERKKTGISKLSDKEKSELQTWIDNLYVKRTEPLAVKATPAEKKALLSENLQNGHYIRLSDNTTWNVRPSDTPISQGWITPVDIIITQSGDPTYPSKLTNSLTGSSIHARKVDRVPAVVTPPVVQPTPTGPTGTPTPAVPTAPNMQPAPTKK